MTDKGEKLIGNLVRLATNASNGKPDLGALAALRSGLGKRPGEAPRMLPYVVPYLEGDSGPFVEAAFLTATLLATHRKHATGKSLGHSLRQSTTVHDEKGVEKRFAAALDAHPEDLPRHLRGLVTLCESADVPIDWYKFLDNVTVLLSDWPDKSDPTRLARDAVRLRWAREFWREDADQTEETPE